MTTSRIVRGTKARIFLYICAVLIITGIIACYNNTISQLDDVRKSNEICHQQQENLSTQLQVISDYKQRLEKSLKTEKVEHQQTKTDYENKLNEEKSKNEKTISESNLRFNSLQQHFNLLQTQHDDFKEESSKTQNKQLNEINDLQAKLKEVQEELKKVASAKENLKTQYLQIQIDKERLEKQVKLSQNANVSNESKINSFMKMNHDLQRELDALKDKCASGYETIQAPNQLLVQDTPSTNIEQNFNKQIKLNSNDYQIKKSDDRPINNKNVGEQPPLQELQEKSVLALPSNMNYYKNGPTKSTTSSSSFKISQARLNGARPLLVPTMTPESANKPSVSLDMKKLPEGVVPVPIEKKTDIDNDDNDADKNELLPNEAINNRYRNKISAEIKEGQIDDVKQKVDDVVDKENVAHEVFDQPLQNGAGYDALGFGDINEHVKNAEKQHFNKQHIDTLGVAGKDNKLYDGADYKDMQNDVPLEENEEDDDEYRDHLARQKDPAVRN